METVVNADEHSDVWKRAANDMRKRAKLAHTSTLQETYNVQADFAEAISKGYRQKFLDDVTAVRFKEDELDEAERKRLHGERSSPAKDPEKADRLAKLDERHLPKDKR